MCDYSIVLPSGSLAVISFNIITRAVVVVDFFSRCIFAPESAIARILLQEDLLGSRYNLLN